MGELAQSFLELNVYTAIAALAVFIVTLGFAPWIVGRLARGAAFVLRVSDRPNITFGELRPDPSTNPHPAYQTWHHLECVNEGQTGWRARLVRTKDARECRVTITFKPSSGDAPSKTDDGIFTLGATSERITTLFVDKPVVIPVYWVADAKRNIFASERGFATRPGYYVTGEKFIYHRAVRDNWKLDPGIYRLTVTVTWEGRRYEYSRELVIPDLASTASEPFDGGPDNRAFLRRVLDTTSADISAGQAILEECGRPREQYYGADPMHFLKYCTPKINSWLTLTSRHIAEHVPEYMGKFQSIGNVTYNTDEKPAMIQQLEAHLRQLESITDELRHRFDAASE